MEIKIDEASRTDKPILQNMMQLYLHDSSEFDGDDLDQHGMFNYNYLDHYWVEPNRTPFLARVDGQLAGFVLVNGHLVYPAENALSIAEFFVLRKYRRKGVGSRMAQMVFDRFDVTWVVHEDRKNVAAQAFWRKIINEYTEGKFTDFPDGTEGWDGPVQIFKSKNRS